MNANPILLQKKYARIIELFAKEQKISREAAMDFFYHSLMYQLIREGVSDLHCMSDGYLAEEMGQEFCETTKRGTQLKKGNLVVANKSYYFLIKKGASNTLIASRRKPKVIPESSGKICVRIRGKNVRHFGAGETASVGFSRISNNRAASAKSTMKRNFLKIEADTTEKEGSK